MNLEITGKLVEKYDTQTVNDRFRKREFVIEVTEEVNGSAFTNFAKMQLVQNKTDIIDRFQIGDMLKINFSIKGNRYERDGKVSYFSNLDAWRIEKADAVANNSQGNANYNQGNNYNNNNNGGNNWNNSSNPGYNNNSGGNWNNNTPANPGNPNEGSFQPANTGNFSGTENADDLPF